MQPPGYATMNLIGYDNEKMSGRSSKPLHLDGQAMFPLLLSHDLGSGEK
jgi:hypothetical protein